MKKLARNRKARHDYSIEETLEAGIVLKGSEVKSIKNGQISLKEAYVAARNEEAFLKNCHIAPFKKGEKIDPTRDRKLLLRKEQIESLKTKTKDSSLTIIPLSAYLKKGLIKIEIGVAKRKKKQDKREDLKKRSQEKKMKERIKKSR